MDNAGKNKLSESSVPLLLEVASVVEYERDCILVDFMRDVHHANVPLIVPCSDSSFRRNLDSPKSPVPEH